MAPKTERWPGATRSRSKSPDAATSRTALALVSARVQAAFPGRCRQYEQPEEGPRVTHTGNHCGERYLTDRFTIA
ncbi:hypothetical protein ACFW84_03365 [Streptomyces anulatus]|uniref:hypothetical protein n=1 Tax=Streptomyces anulatus TaxID=1892 RepID=UPI003696C711